MTMTTSISKVPYPRVSMIILVSANHDGNSSATLVHDRSQQLTTIYHLLNLCRSVIFNHFPAFFAAKPWNHKKGWLTSVNSASCYYHLSTIINNLFTINQPTFFNHYIPKPRIFSPQVTTNYMNHWSSPLKSVAVQPHHHNRPWFAPRHPRHLSRAKSSSPSSLPLLSLSSKLGSESLSSATKGAAPHALRWSWLWMVMVG